MARTQRVTEGWFIKFADGSTQWRGIPDDFHVRVSTYHVSWVAAAAGSPRSQMGAGSSWDLKCASSWNDDAPPGNPRHPQAGIPRVPVGRRGSKPSRNHCRWQLPSVQW